MNNNIFLMLILILSLGLPLFYNMFKSIKMLENYQNYDLNTMVINNI